MLIRKIEIFLRHTGMAPTKFGRLATSDPRFVLDLRNGRLPRPDTEKRVEHFMNIYREALNTQAINRQNMRGQNIKRESVYAF